jgi:hypothetical protein
MYCSGAMVCRSEYMIFLQENSSKIN